MSLLKLLLKGLSSYSLFFLGTGFVRSVDSTRDPSLCSLFQLGLISLYFDPYTAMFQGVLFLFTFRKVALQVVLNFIQLFSRSPKNRKTFPQEFLANLQKCSPLQMRFSQKSKFVVWFFFKPSLSHTGCPKNGKYNE